MLNSNQINFFFLLYLHNKMYLYSINNLQTFIQITYTFNICSTKIKCGAKIFVPVLEMTHRSFTNVAYFLFAVKSLSRAVGNIDC